MNSEDIIRVLSVTDTRTYEEGPDDKWHPVPGSGSENECARCGKLHVIHARVQLRDGSEAIVGTTCADRSSLLFTQLRSAAGKATRRAKLMAQLGAAEARAKRHTEASAQVRELARPAVTKHLDVVLGGGELDSSDAKYELRMGDAAVWTTVRDGITDERRRTLDSCWTRNRLAELGVTWSGYAIWDEVKRLRRRVKNIQA
jgi:hypothetical protein